MIKKTGLILLLMCTIYLVVPFTVEAADKHVSECLDDSEDCLEEMDNPVNSEEGNDGELVQQNTSKPASLFFNIVKMVFALLLVLALIYILLWFIKKRNKYQQVGILENVGGISVGQNKSIQIVRIDSKMYMVGVGDNVELLKELTEVEAQKITENKQDKMQAPSFLQQFLKNETHAPNEPKKSHTDEDFNVSLQAEFNKLRENRHQMIDNHEKKDDGHV